MKRVLYVENEEILRRAVARILGMDYNVTSAENGQEAVECLKAGDFDVVLSDVDMPFMDGIELYEWVRAEKPDLVKRFIFLSGSSDRETGRKIRQTSAKLLEKPCGLGELKAAINEAANV